MANAGNYFDYVAGLFDEGKSEIQVIRRLMWDLDIDPNYFNNTIHVPRTILTVVTCVLSNDRKGFIAWHEVNKKIEARGYFSLEEN